jgi:pimeloyl-ACP methyl ester carboxylesterase
MSHRSLRRLSLVLRQAGWTAAAVRNLPTALSYQGQQLHPLVAAQASIGSRRHHPVVLVHGLGASTDCWGPLTGRLAGESFDRVYAFAYNAWDSGIPELAEALAESVRTVLDETGSRSIHLVGYSLGGLVVRWAAESCGLWPWVSTVVTITTPHRGSHFAWMAPGRAARSMRPGRPLLPDPVTGSAHDRPHYLNFYCTKDAVLTRRSARLQDSAAHNIEITGAGHIGATRADSLLARLPAELAAAELRPRAAVVSDRPAGPAGPLASSPVEASFVAA